MIIRRLRGRGELYLDPHTIDQHTNARPQMPNAPGRRHSSHYTSNAYTPVLDTLYHPSNITAPARSL
jgi:hypothetical protein